VNTWTDSERTRDEIGPDLARSAVKFSKDVKNPQITVTIDDISTNRSRADLVIRGMLYKKPVQGSCSVEIVWDREQCVAAPDLGRFHDGVVQVRGVGRLPQFLRSPVGFVDCAGD
jgi:NMD protein affecting ribosome stability and mRNA decay